MFSYDPALLAAVQQPAQSIGDVLEIMQTIDASCADGDGLKWFNGLYLGVTQAVQTRIAAGGFADPAWLANLDVRFARLYFSALASALSGGQPPECWSVLFERRNQVRLARVQFALAGVNAHINHDLAQAIVDTCRATGTAPEHGSPHYNDFTALNSTLEALVDAEKQSLRVGLLGDALPPIGHAEDAIADWSLSQAREAAWRSSELLWHLRDEALLTETFMRTLDDLATVTSRALLIS